MSNDNLIKQGLLGLQQIRLASAGVQGERATLVTMIGSRWFARTFGKNNATKDIVKWKIKFSVIPKGITLIWAFF